MESHVKSTFRAIKMGLTRSKWWFRRPLILPIAKPRVHYIAALDEVTVTRDGEFARIQYKEGDIADALLEIGPEIVEMSDSEIVELHNEVMRDKVTQASEYKQVAIEMPLGSAQIEYFARCVNGFQEVVCCVAWSSTMNTAR